MFCNNCGKECPNEAKFCMACGSTINIYQNTQVQPQVNPNPINQQLHPGLGCLAAIAILAVIGLIIWLPSKPSTDKNNQAQPVQTQKTGIDAAKFDKEVQSKIAEIDTDRLIGKIETDVYGSVGHVKLYFTSISSWENTTDTGKKEFLNTFGEMMDTIASNAVYPNTESIGISTQVFSPSGLELGERTVFGNVKLK